MDEAVMPAIVLILGMSSECYWRCRDEVAHAGGAPVEASLATATNDALRWRPHVILLTEDVYSFDPPRFVALAEVVGACLAVMGSEDEPADDLRRRVAAAITAAYRQRSDESARVTTRAPAFSGPPESWRHPDAGTPAGRAEAQVELDPGLLPSPMGHASSGVARSGAARPPRAMAGRR